MAPTEEDVMHTYRRLMSRVAPLVAASRAARRRAVVLRAAADLHLPQPDSPPDTYAEFLFRTSGPLLREPKAAGRARGQMVG